MKTNIIFGIACIVLFAGVIQAGTVWHFDPPTQGGPAAAFFKSNGWEEQRGSWDHWQFKDGALYTFQNRDSTLVGHRVNIDPGNAPILKFSFKVDIHPKGADLSKKAREDSALRIFVIFDHGGGLLSPPDTIAYAFGNPANQGRMITSERYGNVKYVVVASGTDQLGKKITIIRDLEKDYRKAFGHKAPGIKAIAIKSDSNNLNVKAQAIVYGIEIGNR